MPPQQPPPCGDVLKASGYQERGQPRSTIVVGTATAAATLLTTALPRRLAVTGNGRGNFRAMLFFELFFFELVDSNESF